MKTLKIGIAGFEEYKARTLAVARGEYVPPAGGPKVWFTSLESLARVLSEKIPWMGRVVNSYHDDVPEAVTPRARCSLLGPKQVILAVVARRIPLPALHQPNEVALTALRAGISPPQNS